MKRRDLFKALCGAPALALAAPKKTEATPTYTFNIDAKIVEEYIRKATREVFKASRISLTMGDGKGIEFIPEEPFRIKVNANGSWEYQPRLPWAEYDAAIKRAAELCD